MKSSKGLTGEAYDKFKEALLNREIELGATLAQSELASTLSVSISPLRDALKVLESEGFVEILPRSGIKINKPDINLIKNCYQLRLILEGAALEKFFESCSQSELDEIHQTHLTVLQRTESVTDENDPFLIEAREIDAKFHRKLIRALDNPIIDSIYKTNNERALLIRLHRSKTTRHFVLTTFNEHMKIINALVEKDIGTAKIALEDHLGKSIQRAMGF